MTRAKLLLASAKTCHKQFAAFTVLVFLLMVVDSTPAWRQMEAASESPNRSPSVIRDVGRENIVPAFSTRGVELWQFEINSGYAVILWDEAGQKKKKPEETRIQ